MRLRATTALTFALAAITLAQAAFSASTNYVEKRRVIHAGVLKIKDIDDLTRKTYHSMSSSMIFYVMGARDDIKPQGWTFENPIAAGNSIHKNQPLYWTVDLSNTSLESLSKFDVLYLSSNTGLDNMGFTMADRDKLRRFVDGGGCLWVDDPNALTLDISDAKGFFLPGVNFDADNVGGTPTPLAMLHPLLTSPFWLSPQEIAEVAPSSGRIINPGFVKDFSKLPNPTMLSPIVALITSMGGVSPTIGAVEYGSGRVVFTATGIGRAIQDPINTGMSPISGATEGPGMMRASTSHLKLAYNIVSWASAYTTLKKDYRRTNSSLETLGAPLVSKWKLPSAGAPGGTLETSPVFWKNVIYYTAGTKLIALDANPPSDLDMDGNPDDGYQDTPGSNGYDKIWEFDFGKSISSPTVASMLDPKGGTLIPKDFVFVMCDDGLVHILEALPADGGRLAKVPLERPDLWETPNYANPAGNNQFALCPPVVQNGWIYAIGRDGVVYAHSPVLAAANASLNKQKTPWAVPLNGNFDPQYAADIKSGPVFGYIKNRATGALVQSLSFFGNLGGQNPQKNDHIFSLPVFVSSDKLTPANGQNLTNPITDVIVYRNSYPYWPMSSYPPPDVWATDNSGRSIPVSIPDNYWDTPGLDIFVKFANIADIDPSVKVYISYAIDFSSAYTNPSRVCPRLTLPPTIVGASGSTIDAKVIGTPALGPNDSFYMGIDWQNAPVPASSLYSVMFDGTNSRLKWNYLLHGGGDIPDPSQSPGSPGGTIDIGMPYPNGQLPFGQAWGVHVKDPVLGYVPVKNMKIVGSPAIANGKVYVTAVANDPNVTKRSFLLCFKADQDFVIKINRPLRTPQGDRMIVSLWQPDLMTDPVASAAPPSLAARPVPGDMIDYSTGTITVNDFTRLRTMGNFGGVITSTGAFTPSLPVWVFLNGNPVDAEEIDLSKWDNMLWSLALPDHGAAPCSGITSSPVVMGDYVYVTCDDGYILAIAADAKATYPNYKILEPDKKNVPWQENIGAGGAAVSLAGAGGILAVPSSNGIKAFGTSSTLVTDNRRVMEISSEGNVTWSCDSINRPRSGGIGASALNKPIVAQKFGPSDYLVVDSGNSRVLRMDRSGNVAWVLTDFQDPDNILRSGEPKTISNPTDAKMWSEYETIGSNQYYVIHTLVVDSGNFRILDIVDKYGVDPTTGQIRAVTTGHTLNWATSTSYRDQMYKFKSIQLVRLPGATLKNQIWASVSNYGLKTFDANTRKSSGGAQLGGAILALEYREKASAAAQWTYSQDSKVVGQLSTFDNGTALSGPTSFVVLNPVGPQLLICDTSHVYRTVGTTIQWSLDQSSYSAMTRSVTGQKTQIQPNPNDDDVPFGDPFGVDTTVVLPFSPQGITVVAPGRYIIANGYGGRVTIPGSTMPKFTGEVFEVVEGNNSIQWYAPSITETWRMANQTATAPTEKITFQKLKNAPNLDQPTCVQKLY